MRSSEVHEQVAALPEDRAKDFRDGEDELTVGNGQADVVGDPTGGLEGPALVAGGAEVAGLTGKASRCWWPQSVQTSRVKPAAISK